MANFAGIPDIMALLQVDITTTLQIASAERALKEATAAIRNYCRQYIEAVGDDTITLDCFGGSRIFLPELPVLEVMSVIEDGETLTESDDYKLGQFGILHRIGRNWAKGIQIVTIDYSHGYDPLPDPIVSIATRIAARIYQAGLRSAENEGILGVVSKQLGDFSVTFGAEGGGGVGEGVMGVSAARMLLMSEKDILDEYRV